MEKQYTKEDIDKSYLGGLAVGKAEGHNRPSPETVKIMGEIKDKINQLPCKEQIQRINYIEKDFENHKEFNTKTMADFNNKIDSLSDKVENIDIKVQKIDVDISWIKGFFWIVASSSIGALIVSIFQLLSRK